MGNFGEKSGKRRILKGILLSILLSAVTLVCCTLIIINYWLELEQKNNRIET